MSIVQMETSKESGEGAQLNKEDTIRSQFTFFRTEMVTTMQEVAKIGKSGPSNVLLGLGTAVLIAAMFLKFTPFGIKVSTLQPSEFITVTIIAFLLLAGGSGLRAYQFTVEMKQSGMVQQAGIELIQSTLTAATGLAQKGSTKKSGL